MKFRTGLVIGLGVGYVLGARAGNERFERMNDTLRRIRSDERVGAVIDRAADITEVPREKTRRVIGGQLRNASEAIKDRTAATG